MAQSASATQPAPQPKQTIAIAALIVAVLGLLFGNALLVKIIDRLPAPPARVDGPACVLAVLNVLLAAYALFYVRPSRAREFTNTAESTAEARETIAQVVHGWRYLWGTWIIMYGWLGVLWFGAFGPSPAFLYVADVLNAINGFWFYYLYFVLDVPSVPTHEQPHRADGFRQAVEAAAFAGIAVCAVSILTDVFARGSVGGGDTTLAKQVIPAYAAIGMAFFFGRLDSHYLHFPRVVLAPLYLYVVMQLSWERVEIASGNTDRIVLLGVALILKFVVFVYVSSALSSGRFARYIGDVNRAERRATGST